MKLLITGGCGFLGSNLVSGGNIRGYDITVIDNLSRNGSEGNLSWLREKVDFNFIKADTHDRESIEKIIAKEQFDAVFHLAGQVAMTTSIANPYLDFQTNTIGTLNVLDSIRRFSPQTAVIYSSTNKVYGDLEQYHYMESNTRYVCEEYPKGFPESVPLDFHSPYGCSKGAADQYMLDFDRIFGLKTVVFRHSSMYGSRQFATYDQGWVGWFCKKAIEKQNDPNVAPFSISGNGKQVRDILHAEDMIQLYYTALENIDKIHGNAYNIGGTMEQSLSLLELFAILEDSLSVKLNFEKLPPRISDQKVFVADIRSIQEKIGWYPKVSSREGISKMIEWLQRIG